MKNLTVFVLYRAKPGQLAKLEAKLGEHAPVLRNKGLLSERPEIIIDLGEGCFMEIIEWATEDAALRAHEIPEVTAIWNAFGEVADFESFAGLPKSITETPFPKATVWKSTPREVVYSDNMVAAKDYSKMVAFYRDLAGLRVENEQPDFTTLVDPTTHQRLCITNGQAIGRWGPGFCSKNLDRSVTELMKNGGNVLKTWEYAFMSGCNVEDPEGNELMIWQIKG